MRSRDHAPSHSRGRRQHSGGSRSRSRSRSWERRSPDAAPSTGDAPVPPVQREDELERLIRRMLEHTLHKFESQQGAAPGSADVADVADGADGTDVEPGTRARSGSRPAAGTPNSDDLARLVLGQVVQFAVRRYLASKTKAAAAATRAAEQTTDAAREARHAGRQEPSRPPSPWPPFPHSLGPPPPPPRLRRHRHRDALGAEARTAGPAGRGQTETLPPADRLHRRQRVHFDEPGPVPARSQPHPARGRDAALALALADLLRQLRRTDDAVCRLLERPPDAVLGRPYRRHWRGGQDLGDANNGTQTPPGPHAAVLAQAADLQRAVARTRSEARGVMACLEVGSGRGTCERLYAVF